MDLKPRVIWSLWVLFRPKEKAIFLSIWIHLSYCRNHYTTNKVPQSAPTASIHMTYIVLIITQVAHHSRYLSSNSTHEIRSSRARHARSATIQLRQTDVPNTWERRNLNDGAPRPHVFVKSCKSSHSSGVSPYFCAGSVSFWELARQASYVRVMCLNVYARGAAVRCTHYTPAVTFMK